MSCGIRIAEHQVAVALESTTMVREQYAERALVAGPCRREEGGFISVAVRGVVRQRFVTDVKRARASELIGPQGSIMEETFPLVTLIGSRRSCNRQ
jgi:hypothetical protein